MTFFTPSFEFINWLIGVAGKLPIIDCGCGDGLLIKQLADRRVKVLGIDPYNVPSFPCSYFLPQFAEEFSVIRTMPAVLTFCRPDHGGWVEPTIDVAHPLSRIYYIGLERNLEIDFQKYVPIKLELGFDVGGEGENVYTIDTSR